MSVQITKFSVMNEHNWVTCRVLSCKIYIYFHFSWFYQIEFDPFLINILKMSMTSTTDSDWLIVVCYMMYLQYSENVSESGHYQEMIYPRLWNFEVLKSLMNQHFFDIQRNSLFRAMGLLSLTWGTQWDIFFFVKKAQNYFYWT